MKGLVYNVEHLIFGVRLPRRKSEVRFFVHSVSCLHSV